MNQENKNKGPRERSGILIAFTAFPLFYIIGFIIEYIITQSIGNETLLAVSIVVLLISSFLWWMTE